MATDKTVKTYKKAEFAVILAKKANITKKDASTSIDAFISALEEVLANGDSVNFIGFGGFSIGHREARVGRNPQTGEPINIKASKVVKFKVGSILKENVND